MSAFLLLSGLLLLPPTARAGDPAAATEATAQAAFPSPNRTWNAADYEATAARMAGLPPTSWPRAGSPLFARICDPDNLAPRVEPSADLQRILTVGQASVAVLQQYLVATMQGTDMGTEILGVTGFQMRWAVAQWETMDAFIAIQPAGFADLASTQQGLAQTRVGTATMLAGSLTQLEGHAEFDDDAIVAFAGVMVEVVPKLLPRIDAETRAESLGRLDALAASLPAGPLKVAVEEAASQGRSAVE